MSHDRLHIAAIKAALADPLRIAQQLGLDKGARRQRGGLLVSCPAHGDRTPSCSLTWGADHTLRVRCFGCDLSGDIFTLLGATLGLDPRRDFAALLQRAAELADVDLDESDESQRPPRSPRLPAGPPPLSDEDFHALVQPLLHLGRLDTAEEERERGRSSIAADVAVYLEQRGLLDEARREGWAALPAAPYQREWVKMLVDIFGEEVVKRSGLCVGETFARPENRLVIAWRNAEGLVTTIQRRRLDAAKSAKYIFPFGSARAPTAPYGVHRLADAPPAWPIAIVEGAIDTLALSMLARQRGELCAVLGIPGVSSWRAAWGAFARGRVAYVGIDADQAGERACAIIARDLAEGGAIRVERLSPEHGRDWAEALEAA